jgi:hypothetical protein
VKEPEVTEVKARLGDYLLSKLFFYIARENQPIELRILAVKVLQQALGEVPLPLAPYINRDYRRVVKVYSRYKKVGYLKTTVFSHQPRSGNEELINVLWYLHRYLRREGKLPFESWKEYKFKALGFQDLVKGAILSVFVVFDHLLVPSSKDALVRKTSYDEHSMVLILTALRYLGILDYKRKKYVLRDEKEKILEIMKAGLECKKRWIQRIRNYIKAKELFVQGLPIGKIAREIKVAESNVRDWLCHDSRPRLKLKTAQLFLNQKLIDETELSIWQREGILY